MTAFFAPALLAMLGFMVLDALWLGLLMTSFYTERLASIARMTGGAMAPNWPAAFVVYALLGTGIAVFAIPRAGQAGSAAAFGALLGLVVYGVYDFTNYSTLRDWPLALALVDTAWGALATALVTLGVWMITR